MAVKKHKQVTVELETALYQQLKERAKQERHTIKTLINYAVRELLKLKEFPNL